MQPVSPASSRKRRNSSASDQDIYDRVFQAILERRLRPGAHLREVELAEMFGVSRTKVRQALARLIQDGVVALRSNRGAAVAAPSRAQARQVFALRAILEPEIAAQAAGAARGEVVAELRRHVEVEDGARARGDEAELIRRTGEFHLRLAAVLGNPLIDKLLMELEALTCLSIVSYARADGCACLPDEHRSILDAVGVGDAARARALMAEHLDHVRADLDLRDPAPAAVSLSEALGVGVPHRRRGQRGTAGGGRSPHEPPS